VNQVFGAETVTSYEIFNTIHHLP